MGIIEEEWLKAVIGQVVQFTENHKWCGALGFVRKVKKCGDDYRFMIGCTMLDNQDGCNTAYIYSMLSKKEFEPLLDGYVILMPKGGEE